MHVPLGRAFGGADTPDRPAVRVRHPGLLPLPPLPRQIWYGVSGGAPTFILPFLNIFYSDTLRLSAAQIGLLAAVRPWISAPAGESSAGPDSGTRHPRPAACMDVHPPAPRPLASGGGNPTSPLWISPLKSVKGGVTCRPPASPGSHTQRRQYHCGAGRQLAAPCRRPHALLHRGDAVSGALGDKQLAASWCACLGCRATAAHAHGPHHAQHGHDRRQGGGCLVPRVG